MAEVGARNVPAELDTKGQEFRLMRTFFNTEVFNSDPFRLLASGGGTSAG